MVSEMAQDLESFPRYYLTVDGSDGVLDCKSRVAMWNCSLLMTYVCSVWHGELPM